MRSHRPPTIPGPPRPAQRVLRAPTLDPRLAATLLASALLLGALHSARAADQSPPLVTSPPPPSRPGGSATPPAVGSPGTATMNCGPGMRGGGPAGRLAAADANHDGRVSRSEFLRFHEAMFDQMPKDRSGQVRLGGSGQDASGISGQDAAERTPPTSDRDGVRSDRDDARDRGGTGTGSGADAASSSQSAPASTPSSTAPQEAKPGKR